MKLKTIVLSEITSEIATRCVFWGDEDSETVTHTDIDDAIESRLSIYDTDDLPNQITVCGWVRRRVDASFTMRTVDLVLEHLLSLLDEEYGDWEGTETKPSKSMEINAKQFVDSVVAEYTPWQCDPVIRVLVPVREWVVENCPHWLEDEE